MQNNENLNILEASVFCGHAILHILSCLLLLQLIYAGDTEVNPSPRKRDFCYNLSLCHWNLNRIAAHNFSKFTLLEAYNMKHKFVIISLSETYLSSSIQYDDERLHLNGCKLARADDRHSHKDVQLVFTLKCS